MLVILDFDGTLADTWSLFADELVANAKRFRYKQFDRSEIEDLRRLETKEVFRALGISWWKLPRVVSFLRGRAAELTPRIRLFPGIRDLVLALSDAGHTLAVVSSNLESTVRDVLGNELSGRVTLFNCSSSVFGKASKFRKLRRRAGVPASAIVAVGDETRDLDAAKKAGIASIAVEWGYNDPALLRRRAPGRTAATARELLEMITHLSAHSRIG